MREDGKKPLPKHADNKVWKSMLFADPHPIIIVPDTILVI
ncbi:hypothetical protein BH18THE2_BH18THE2_12270 [soil metagenome]